MTVVLVILAVVWAIVLIPPAIRARAEGRPGDSITNFRHQLAVLHRTSPRARFAGEARSRSVSPPLSPMASVSRIDAHGSRNLNGRPGSPIRSPRTAIVSASAAARRRSQRRRRDVLITLLSVAVGTLALGLVPSLRMLLLVHLFADLLLVAYVALLIRQRDVAAEREMKVRFLPGAGVFGPDAVREPALLRRSAN